MADEKKGPNDGGNYYQKGDDDNQSEEERGLRKDEKFRKETEDLEEIGREMEERKKQKLKQFRMKGVKTKKQIRKEEESKVGGQITKRKVFDHKREDLFVRNKLKNYLRKIEEKINKTHGLSTKEKKLFPEALGAYNPSKSVLEKKKLKKFIRGLKHKTYKGSDFNRLKKTFDTDFLKKNLGNKRTMNKIKEALLGGENRLKHTMKQTSNRNPGADKIGSNSARVRVGKRF
ncbi:MAG: hypothetical protein KAQ87_02100 [Candidatus Pacebacteria bacterium]|nr:hypothetical protein [Candidatus Paceibacterota bacterium]